MNPIKHNCKDSLHEFLEGILEKFWNKFQEEILENFLEEPHQEFLAIFKEYFVVIFWKISVEFLKEYL